MARIHSITQTRVLAQVKICHGALPIGGVP
jgi:hypothetical protein